jgi:hypothetical protein
MGQAFIDLVAIFDNIPVPSVGAGPGRFCAREVPGFPGCAVGKDTSGGPVLLVEADNTQPTVGAPILLEHLSVSHLVKCRVQVGEENDRETIYSVIRCIGGDRGIHDYFLRSLHPIVASLPNRPSRHRISEAIHKLVDLFSQIKKSPRKTISGLWAELLLIARARDPAFLLSCWHAAPEDRYDFGCGGDRLDVKSALGNQRFHYFSLEQIRPLGPIRVMLASVLIAQAEGGTSVNDLVDLIRTRAIDPEMLIRLDSVVAQTVGEDWRSMRDLRFDLQLAVHSLRFVEASALPAVQLPIPPEVSEVHFRVDLSQHALPFPSHLVQDSDMFKAAIPVQSSGSEEG